MKHFKGLFYERISYEDTKKTIVSLIERLSDCKRENIYIEICKEIITIQNHIEEMYDYTDISNMRDLNDAFYREEIEYWNQYKPKFDLLFLDFYQLILDSPYKALLEKVMPDNFFTIISYQLQITSSAVLNLQQQENILKTKYRELNRNTILFDGEEKTISSISTFFSHRDRNIRKRAHDAVNDYYYENRDIYKQIFLELVQVRNAIAHELGFENYVSYSLLKQKRFGYDYHDISRFRENVVQYIVPICEKLSIWQKEELGLETLTYYDTVYFTEMPNLYYQGEVLLEKLFPLFAKLDGELGNLFSVMIHNGYIDLVSRQNKVNFSITNYLTETCFPTITGNFKNNYLDVGTTFHEMGHAFQKYCASVEDKNKIVSSLLKYPTMEVAEMFSYAMELFSPDVIKDMFSSLDYSKYCFMKFYGLISNLPYICLVDEFQQRIYSQDILNLEDVGSIWLELVQKYHLERGNTGHINLDTGGYFYRQTHIYLDPFYYIDYGLSYFGAISIWSRCRDSLQLFKEIASVASYYSFSTLIEKYHMPNPFDEKVVEGVSKTLYQELSKYKTKIK